MIAIVGATLVFGRSLFTAARFDPILFLMGAAFLLIETRSVTELSLLFGSTWLVNAAVFGAVESPAANGMTTSVLGRDERDELIL